MLAAWSITSFPIFQTSLASHSLYEEKGIHVLLQYVAILCCNMLQYVPYQKKSRKCDVPISINMFIRSESLSITWPVVTFLKKSHHLTSQHWAIGPLARNGYGSIAIDTIFSGLFTSINPSYDLGFTARYQGAMKKSPNGGSDWDSVHQTDLRNRPVVFAGRTGVRPLGMDSDGAPKSKKTPGKHHENSRL